MGSGKFYITTPIYYVNANPHIGHAYTQVAVDALTRYHKMLGEDVFFLTGTDEHGEKIEEACLRAGYSEGEEKKFVDKIVDNFKEAWKALGIEHNGFIRTTDSEHEKVVQEFLQKMYDKGDIYQGEYDGWYCTPCETFLTEKQAENGNCPECGRPVNKIKEKNYFFKMGNHQKWLIDYINDNPSFIMPSFRKNEVLGFLREELNDLCVSRPKDRMSWGIELPFDKDYVVYVWFDALINYASGLREKKQFDKFWPADFHMIAKDIIRHHAVYWPIMLKSMDMELPKTIFAHGWWKMGKDKMSKSKGNIVDPLELIEKYNGPDPLRYFLLRAVSLGSDGDFSETALVSVYNTDLANDLGNLLNRTLTMVEKYFNGISPEVSGSAGKEQETRSNGLRDIVIRVLPQVKDNLLSPKLLIKEAIEQIMGAIGKANKYIEESAPWVYAKEGNTEAIKLIMADLLEVLRISAIGLFPVMPETSRKMWRQLGLGDLDKDLKKEAIRKELAETKAIGSWRRFPVGTKVAKGDPLFPRIQ